MRNRTTIASPTDAPKLIALPGARSGWNWYCAVFVGLCAALLGWFAYTSPYDRSPWTLVLSCLVFVLGSIPAFLYLWSGFHEAIPTMAVHGFWYAVTFGLCGFQRSTNLNPILRPSETALQTALLYVAAGLAALNAGYYLVGLKVFRDVRRFSFPKGLPEAAYEPFAWATAGIMTALWLAAHFAGEYLSSIANAFIEFTVVVLAYLAFSKKLSPAGKLFFWALFVPSLMLFRQNIDKGYLYGLVATIIVFVLVYVRIWKKIPLLILAVPVLIILFLQPAKGRFRADTDYRTDLSRLERYQLYFQYALEYYSGAGGGQDSGGDGRFYDKTLERVNNIVITAAVIQATPDRVPYWNGATYYPLLHKWIPRLIWPDKPREDLGNRWAHYYRLLDDSDFMTSFNLPWLPEFYINFGLFGIVAGMFIVGVAFAFLHYWVCRDPAGLPEYAFGFALAQPVFFVECNLSSMAGGIIIAVICLLILVRIPLAIARKAIAA